jgi:aarF domain-containing kinase
MFPNVPAGEGRLWIMGLMALRRPLLLERARRSVRVGQTGARLFFGYRRERRRSRSLPPDVAEARMERRHEAGAELLYRLAVDLKGLYIKTGQFVGSRADLVPMPYVRSLSRLQDRVPPRDVAEVRHTIESELKRPIDELFARFDPEPLAAASLAQVHRAALHDGREVAVKVQYPEVESLVRLDLRNLKMAVRVVARFEPSFDYRSVVEEIGRYIPEELDFEREARLTGEIARNLSGFPDIVLPRVVERMVTRKVLVTEYIEGARLLDTAAREQMTRDATGLAQRLADAYGHQILVDGLFQADPHPGNILILPGGRIALLDFGLVKVLPDAMRLAFARLVMAAASREPARVVGAFRELGVRTKSDDPDSVVALMRLFFDTRPLGEGGAFLQRQSSALRANPVEALPGDLVLLGRVVGLLRGVSASLGVALSPMQMLRPYAERALEDAGA